MPGTGIKVPEAVDDQQTQRKQDAVAQVGGLAQSAQLVLAAMFSTADTMRSVSLCKTPPGPFSGGRRWENSMLCKRDPRPLTRRHSGLLGRRRSCGELAACFFDRVNGGFRGTGHL